MEFILHVEGNTIKGLETPALIIFSKSWHLLHTIIHIKFSKTAYILDCIYIFFVAQIIHTNSHVPY